MEPHPPSQPAAPQPGLPPTNLQGYPMIEQVTPLSNRLVGWIGTAILVMGLAFIVPVIFLGTVSVVSSATSKEQKKLSEKHHSLEKHGDHKVAIIQVTGPIMESDGYIKKQIEQIQEDDDVKAVVLRIDSPGGGVAATDHLFYHMKKIRTEKKVPFVVSMGTVAASGGYYLAMVVDKEQENTIFAEHSTITGSIGVLLPRYDISELLAKWNIEDKTISSHHRKQFLSSTKKWKPEIEKDHTKLLENFVKQSFDRFKAVILSGRKMKGEQLDKLATGEIFSAQQAVENGLVDKIGYLEDAIDRAIELAKLDKDRVQVVKYKRQLSFFDSLGEAKLSMGKGEAPFSYETLRKLSQPRVYYYYGSLPPLPAH